MRDTMYMRACTSLTCYNNDATQKTKAKKISLNVIKYKNFVIIIYYNVILKYNFVVTCREIKVYSFFFLYVYFILPLHLKNDNFLYHCCSNWIVIVTWINITSALNIKQNWIMNNK